MSTVIRAENVSKRYRLGVVSRRTLYEDIQSRWARRRGKVDPNSKLAKTETDSTTELWALRDIDFEVKDGDILGLIGHNGSGKSTLLKILSQITAPTTGRVFLKGRVASLLEVGTGFHPELTGRDNVFLNGVILGMKRDEIAKKFDEIVAFSGVEQFIDTPVKRYSSGMRVRLAFAVASSLDPEILVIDEVLAVGDQAFQKKCLGRIGEVARSGRTVLFVSHNAAAVAALCTRGIVLKKGRMTFDGTPSDALDHYGAQLAAEPTGFDNSDARSGSGEVRVTAVEFRDFAGKPVGAIRAGQDLDVCFFFEQRRPCRQPGLCVRLFVTTELGSPIFSQLNDLDMTSFEQLPESGAFVFRVPRLPLNTGSYRLGFRITASRTSPESIDEHLTAVNFAVGPGAFFASGILPPPATGASLVDGVWRIDETLVPAPRASLPPVVQSV